MLLECPICITGQVRPQPVLPHRINGQYIMEGLTAGFMYTAAGWLGDGVRGRWFYRLSILHTLLHRRGNDRVDHRTQQKPLKYLQACRHHSVRSAYCDTVASTLMVMLTSTCFAPSGLCLWVSRATVAS